MPKALDCHPASSNSWRWTSSARCGRSGRQHAHAGVSGGLEVKTSTILIMALASVSIWVLMAFGVTAVWLTEELRVLGLLTASAAIVACLLVVYFDWRGRLQRRIVAERDDSQARDKAA